MPEQMMTQEEIEELRPPDSRESAGEWLDRIEKSAQIVHTALALYKRLAAFEEGVRDYLDSNGWQTRGVGDEHFCGECWARLHQNEPHKPRCSVGQLEKLMEAPDA